MFQKLYRHLEEINANTQQQEANFQQAQEWAEKISTQLEMLNTSVRSLDQRRPRRGPQVAGFILAGMVLVLLVILSSYTFRLSTVMMVVETCFQPIFGPSQTGIRSWVIIDWACGNLGSSNIVFTPLSAFISQLFGSSKTRT